MDFSIDPDNGSGTLILEGDLTIQMASELKKTLQDSLELTDHCRMNLQNVTTVDLACMQLLYSAWKTAKAQDKTISLDGDCPNVLKQAAEDTGFADHDWMCFGK